jgi:hypothetical protein
VVAVGERSWPGTVATRWFAGGRGVGGGRGRGGSRRNEDALPQEDRGVGGGGGGTVTGFLANTIGSRTWVWGELGEKKPVKNR